MSIPSVIVTVADQLQSEAWSQNGQFSYQELQEIRTILSRHDNTYELIGSGSTRIVVRSSEEDVVYKINCIPSDSQNKTEVRIWNQGCRNIPQKHLAEVFSWTDSYTVIEMEYCRDLSELTLEEFHTTLSEFYDGYYEYTDEGAKDSWGFSSDGVIKCRDYGRALVSENN